MLGAGRTRWGRCSRWSSATALTFIAFYSDTRHAVLPVETGYRVALTYNVRLSGDATAVGPVAVERAAAAAAVLVRQHFDTPVEARWRHDSAAGEPPDRLVFLLDHHDAPEAHDRVSGTHRFESGDLKLHLGVEGDFRPAKKAHPASIVRAPVSFHNPRITSLRPLSDFRRRGLP